MKQNEIVGAVEAAIQSANLCDYGYWSIAWLNGKVQCIAGVTRTRVDQLFGTFSRSRLQKGLRSQEWDLLQAEIWHYLLLKGKI